MNKYIILLLLSVVLNGCGAIIGTFREPEPYIGSKIDIHAYQVINRHPENSVSRIFVSLVVLLDLPMSTALDTALLPYTLVREELRKE